MWGALCFLWGNCTELRWQVVIRGIWVLTNTGLREEDYRAIEKHWVGPQHSSRRPLAQHQRAPWVVMHRGSAIWGTSSLPWYSALSLCL